MAVVSAGTGTGPGNQIALLPNISPQNIAFKSSVILSTVDQNNNNVPIIEGYIVSGPTSPGVAPTIIANSKAIIPLTTSSANGAPYLKIWFPTNPNGNTLYVTYCVANQYMMDGFYDYTTGVPTAYFNALRAWINTNPITGQPYANAYNTVRTRQLKFIGYGSSTNKPANAVTFFINFQGTFSPTMTAVISGTGTVATGGFSLGL